MHANLNKNLQIIGLLRVMFDPRITLQQQVSEQLKASFRRQGVRYRDPANVRLRGGAQLWLAGRDLDLAARGSQAFIASAEELVRKMPPASALASPAPAPAPMEAPPVTVRDPNGA